LRHAFSGVFTACGCVFKEITLVWANRCNYFDNATARSYHNDKSRLISLPISNQYCNSVCLKCGLGNSTEAVESDAKRCLASSLLEQIKISCYTEYKVFRPSLIYNTNLNASWKCVSQRSLKEWIQITPTLLLCALVGPLYMQKAISEFLLQKYIENSFNVILPKLYFSLFLSPGFLG